MIALHCIAEILLHATDFVLILHTHPTLYNWQPWKTLHYSALNKSDPINYLCKAHNTSVFCTVGRRDVYTPVEYTPELGGTLAHPLLLSPPGMGGVLYSSSVHLGFPPNSRKTATFALSSPLPLFPFSPAIIAIRIQ